MNSPSGSGAENLKSMRSRALSVAVRSISGEGDIELDFFPEGRLGAAPPPPSENAPLEGRTLRLPLSGKCSMPAREVAVLRGRADAAALRLAHHDPRTHARRAPKGEQARHLFDLLEQARIESIGARRMAGVAQNLSDVLEQRWRDEIVVAATPPPTPSPRELRVGGGGEAAEAGGAPHTRADAVSEVVALLARERLADVTVPGQAEEMLALWRPWIEAKAGKILDRLEANLERQEDFAECVWEMLSRLGWGEEGSEGEAQEEESEQQEDSPEDDESAADGDSDAAQESDSLPADGAPSQEGEDMQDGAQAGEADAQGEGEDGAPGDVEAGRGAYPADWSGLEGGEYQVFTSAHDEVVQAESLCSAEELHLLRAQLDRQLDVLQGAVARLAHRLQRRLLAMQKRDWEFELEEGILDSARLARVICDPGSPLSFKIERETRFRDTLVSLLLDNSGSMRGRPINTAAICADILARTLERCGVGVEILGFTTRAWKGGRAREEWIAAGKPENPGRLNELRHIIYKAADVPWRRARRSLGLMLREGLLKENIDGEAVAWAHRRLLARPEQRRILMVISDGAPVDDSTLSVNRGNYLERHLRHVIARIEGAAAVHSPLHASVQLIAIGIGHDVTRFYRRAVTLNDAAQLGGAMVDQLVALFDEQERARPPARLRR